MTGPRVAYCLLDSSGSARASVDALEPFYAASTIKIAVVAAVARSVDAGNLDWDMRTAVTRRWSSGVPAAGEFRVGVDDEDERLPPDGSLMTIADLSSAMIERSSNEATNILAQMVGLRSVADVLADANAVGCRMERLIGDTAARDLGATNEVTPLGLARLMLALARGTLATASATSRMCEWFGHQEFPCIGRVVPEAWSWGSKSGWVPGFEHDVAFFGPPASADRNALAVCTSGFNERQGQVAIERVTAVLLTGANWM